MRVCCTMHVYNFHRKTVARNIFGKKYLKNHKILEMRANRTFRNEDRKNRGAKVLSTREVQTIVSAVGYEIRKVLEKL